MNKNGTRMSKSWLAIVASLLLALSTTPATAAMQRTVVFMYGVTAPGQNMFLRGGSNVAYTKSILGTNCSLNKWLCAMPIKHRLLKTDPNRVNDKYLDWNTREAGQTTAAQGSPMVWTTNNRNDAHKVATNGYGYDPENAWGPNYWKLDVMMDCSKAPNGWFELKSFISNGPGYEPNVKQADVPYAATNHLAKCGYVNKFERGSNAVTFIAGSTSATCANSTMFLMSSARNFGVDPTTGQKITSDQGSDATGLAMRCINDIWTARETFAGTGSVFHAGAFKFATTQRFAGERGLADGDTFSTNTLHNTGSGGPEGDIIIPEGQQGTYDIDYNDRTKQWKATMVPKQCASPSPTLRLVTDGATGGDMYCVGKNQWAFITMYAYTYADFHFETADGIYYGRNQDDFLKLQGSAVANGVLITIKDPGRYLVTFNGDTSSYSFRKISRACGQSKMSLRFATGGDRPMECENGHWAYDVNSQTNPAPVGAMLFTDGTTLYGDLTASEVKLDPNGSGKLEYVGLSDEIDPAKLGTNKMKIPASDNYHIHFYDNWDNNDNNGLPQPWPFYFYKLCRGHTCTQ